MGRAKINKTAAIKDAMKANPDKGPKELAEMLTKGGVKVSPMYVSNVKASLNKSKGRKGKRGRVALGKGRFGVDAVEETIVFVKEVGGIDQAKQLLALLEKARGV
jgi:hypothetical protein